MLGQSEHLFSFVGGNNQTKPASLSRGLRIGGAKIKVYSPLAGDGDQRPGLALLVCKVCKMLYFLLRSFTSEVKLVNGRAVTPNQRTKLQVSDYFRGLNTKYKYTMVNWI